MNKDDSTIGLRVVGSYVVREKIAEGGMGSIYIAVNDLGQKKVVKFLLPEFSSNEVIRERFRREATAAARLHDSPHVVKIDDVGALPDGRQFMTMEYLHGQTLQAHLKSSGRLTPHHALHLVAQIGRGLSELHRAGIVHRDLKPGNIFLTKTDDNPYYVKLIDLGIAHDSIADRPDGMLTQTGTTMGTPGYMAPEQFGRAGEVTPSADLYALAVIMWEMLVGDLPWGVDDPRVIYFKQMSEQPPQIAKGLMPAPWESVLRRALSPRPPDRPGSIYKLLTALAMELPPDPKLSMPSGVHIFARFGGMRHASAVDETVRAPTGQLPPISWNPSPGATPLDLPLPAPPPTPHPTTLGSATGAKMAQVPRRSAAAAIFVAAVLCIVAVGVVRGLREHGPATTAAPDAALIVPPPIDAPAAPIDAIVAAPADAPIDAAQPVPATKSRAPSRGSAMPKLPKKFDPDAVEE